MSNKTRNLAKNLLAIMAMGATVGAIPGVNAAEQGAPKTETKKGTDAKSTKEAPTKAKGSFSVGSAGIGFAVGASTLGATGLAIGRLTAGGGSGPMKDDKGNPLFKNSAIMGVMGDLIKDANARKLATTGCRAALIKIAEDSKLLKQGTEANKPVPTGVSWIAAVKAFKGEKLGNKDANYLPENGVTETPDDLVDCKTIDFGNMECPDNKADANKPKAESWAVALSIVGGSADKLKSLKGTGLKVEFKKGGAAGADFELVATSADETKAVTLTGKVGQVDTYKFTVAS